MCLGGISVRILGIDPGYATIGYGVIDYNKNRFSVAGYGAITTPAGIPFERRLSDIYNDMNELIKKYRKVLRECYASGNYLKTYETKRRLTIFYDQKRELAAIGKKLINYYNKEDV